MSYFPSIYQSVTADPNNSMSDVILTEAIWHDGGTGTSTLGVNAIQIVVDSDKNVIVYVDQGRTDSSFQVVDQFIYNPSTDPDFGITVQAVGAYVRVRVKNTAAATATVIVDTVLCPIVEALPRALTQKGSLKTAQMETTKDNRFSSQNMISPDGAMRVCESSRLVGATLSGSTIDDNFWTVDNHSSAGTTTMADGRVDLATNGANGSTSLTSVRTARYVSGNMNIFRSVARVGDLGNSNNVRRWGAFNNNDGYFFELSGTNFRIVSRKTTTAPAATTDTPVARADFNGDYGNYILDTHSHTWEIVWTNRTVYYLVDGSLLHKSTFADSPGVSTPHLPVRYENENSNGEAGNYHLFTRVGSIHRLGSLTAQPTSYYRSTTTSGIILKRGPGNLSTLIVGSVAASGCVVTLYDGITAATIIASFTLNYPEGGAFTPLSLSLGDIPFFTGLYLVIANQNASVTVVY